MAYNWINPQDYTMDTLLLFDRWIIRYLMNENNWYNHAGRDYKTDLAKALSRYPHVIAFCQRKAPECTNFISQLPSLLQAHVSAEEARLAEVSLLTAYETFIVYAYPEVMDQVNYIRNWNPQSLYSLVDLTDKIVLDVGAGTGRLAFAAADRARRVYASEPCDSLREYMRDRIKSSRIQNMKVLDGMATELPYEDSTFDVVMSGHVVGDSYDQEIAELTRITKSGGWIVCCNGDDEFKRTAPNKELLDRGFESFSHESMEGGIIYDYRKRVVKT
ncbi:MAG: methyltransferase type 11 [Paenibacillaceae bacterium]|jgi:SAM-dependent methyltransferase|nr:methyltransferase type 11 [Paenibacillaceae bacterium]